MGMLLYGHGDELFLQKGYQKATPLQASFQQHSFSCVNSIHAGGKLGTFPPRKGEQIGFKSADLGDRMSWNERYIYIKTYLNLNETDSEVLLEALEPTGYLRSVTRRLLTGW